MQFLSKNCHNVVLPKLYLMNRQELKEKYDISANSTRSAKQGNDYHFGAPNGTLINEFIGHDTRSGPLKTFDLGDY